MKKLIDRSPIIVEDASIRREIAETDARFGEWSVIEVANAAKALWAIWL
ncbi:hypothetical protein [Mesorhizobium atlanticum]|nr:hypothetical protein [Mesorhizobium atlanticum]